MLSYKVKCSIGILYELSVAATAGRRLTSGELAERLGIDRYSLSTVLAPLRRAKWVDTINSRHILLADIFKATLCDLVEAVDGVFIMGSCLMDGWPKVNRHKYGAALKCDSAISQEFKERLKQMALTELFPENCAALPEQPVKKTVRRKMITQVA